MTPYYHDDWLTVYQGDCRAALAAIPDESVHCVVTSPPYWGLRDYGTASWEGGDEDCDHSGVRREGGNGDTFTNSKQATSAGSSRDPVRHSCRRCGAVRQDSQLGLEPTPEQYVENMVAVFREVRRVLRNDGTLWLNLGDSYFSHDPGGYRQGEFLNPGGRPPVKGEARNRAGNHVPGAKRKDLVGIPWRVAFALQADGWYLRSDIIWAKPNPMPESVTDRPTKSHEYLFLLAKSERYYFDADAVREPPLTGVWPGIGPKHGTTDNHKSDYAPMDVNAGRNIRSVWNIATQPYPGAHFATFPPKLVEPCIKAGSSERGVCPECSAPWRRETEIERSNEGGSGRAGNIPTGKLAGGSQVRVDHDIRLGPTTKSTTIGWRPGCAHGGEPVAATVLDPFAGSGTTLMVAQSLSRRAIGIDLSADYLVQCLRRNAQTPLGLSG